MHSADRGDGARRRAALRYRPRRRGRQLHQRLDRQRHRRRGDRRPQGQGVTCHMSQLRPQPDRPAEQGQLVRGPVERRDCLPADRPDHDRRHREGQGRRGGVQPADQPGVQVPGREADLRRAEPDPGLCRLQPAGHSRLGQDGHQQRGARRAAGDLDAVVRFSQPPDKRPMMRPKFLRRRSQSVLAYHAQPVTCRPARSDGWRGA